MPRAFRLLRLFQFLTTKSALEKIKFVLFNLVIICAVTSCKEAQSPFYGNWSRSFPNNNTLSGDSAFLKFMEQSSFQLWFSNFVNGAGYVHTELAAGEYIYSGGQLILLFKSGPGGSGVCIGTDADYIYTITNTNSLALVPMNDTCEANSEAPRSVILGGNWSKY